MAPVQEGRVEKCMEGWRVNYQQVQFGNEPVSERVQEVHVVRSVVDLFQEVLKLLDENALLEPLNNG